MLRRVALVRTDVSEELSAYFIRVLRGVRRLLFTASVVPSSSIFVTLMKEALSSSETSVLTRATQRNIPEDTILQNREQRRSVDFDFQYCKRPLTPSKVSPRCCSAGACVTL
jgi:hypothetical protein